jgi:hypothetical protein
VPIAAGVVGGTFEAVRTLLYSTARRGHVIESMFIRLRRGQASQTFSFWGYGEQKLYVGSGLFVGHEGVAVNHHFLLPKDGSRFEFLPGDYALDVFAVLVNGRSPLLLAQVELHVTERHAEAINNEQSALFFNWGPDSGKYHTHIDPRPPPLTLADAFSLPSAG